MSRARRKPVVEQSPLVLEPGEKLVGDYIVPDAVAATVSTGNPLVASVIPTQTVAVLAEPSQLDKANALAHAREAGEREGIIKTFCECAAIAHNPNDILAELRRRYGADDSRVRYHMRLRGLS